MEKRKIILYRNYFLNFYSEQEPKVQEKIEFVLDLIRFEERVPSKFFKALKGTDGIYEIRVMTTFKNIRLLCFLEDDSLVILANSFIKKNQKVPRREIRKAEKIKQEYLNEKR